MEPVLLVVRPFEGRDLGAIILDTDEVAGLLRSEHANHVVKIASPISIEAELKGV